MISVVVGCPSGMPASERDSTVPCDVTGDYDLRGYLGIDDTRPGFGAISYTVHVDTDADDSTLDKIRKAAEDGSRWSTTPPTPPRCPAR